MRTAPLKKGDRVRTSTGEQGDLITLDSDGLWGHVKIDTDLLGQGTVRIPLNRLTRVVGGPDSGPTQHT
jgi:hypothetical protein